MILIRKHALVLVLLNCSDEGDSSSSCDEGKDSICDLEGPCCQTLRVPPSSPVLVQKKSTSGKKVKWMFLASSQIIPWFNGILIGSLSHLCTYLAGKRSLEASSTRHIICQEQAVDTLRDGHSNNRSWQWLSRLLHHRGRVRDRLRHRGQSDQIDLLTHHENPSRWYTQVELNQLRHNPHAAGAHRNQSHRWQSVQHERSAIWSQQDVCRDENTANIHTESYPRVSADQ